MWKVKNISLVNQQVPANCLQSLHGSRLLSVSFFYFVLQEKILTVKLARLHGRKFTPKPKERNSTLIENEQEHGYKPLIAHQGWLNLQLVRKNRTRETWQIYRFLVPCRLFKESRTFTVALCKGTPSKRKKDLWGKWGEGGLTQTRHFFPHNPVFLLEGVPSMTFCKLSVHSEGCKSPEAFKFKPSYTQDLIQAPCAKTLVISNFKKYLHNLVS